MEIKINLGCTACEETYTQTGLMWQYSSYFGDIISIIHHHHHHRHYYYYCPIYRVENGRRHVGR